MDIRGVGLNAAKKDIPQTYSGGQRGRILPVTSATAITVDFNLANNFSVTATANFDLEAPLGLENAVGQSGTFLITQDSTGSRTMLATGVWEYAGGSAPTLTTTTGAVDRVDYFVASTGSVHIVVGLDVKN